MEKIVWGCGKMRAKKSSRALKNWGRRLMYNWLAMKCFYQTKTIKSFLYIHVCVFNALRHLLFGFATIGNSDHFSYFFFAAGLCYFNHIKANNTNRKKAPTVQPNFRKQQTLVNFWTIKLHAVRTMKIDLCNSKMM